MNYFIRSKDTNRMSLKVSVVNADIIKTVNDLGLQRVSWLKFQLFKWGVIKAEISQKTQNAIEIPSIPRTELLFEEYLKTGHNRTEAEDYAILCFRALVERYGADPAEIDFEDVVEGALGHLLLCEFDEDETQMTPDKWIKKWLAARSDYGLDQWGLTREQYNRVLQMEASNGR